MNGGHMVDKVKDSKSEEKLPASETRIGGSKGIRPGRPKGAKNKSTLIREAIQGDFDKMLETKAKKIFEVVADQALEGCRQSQKMILDRVVATMHASPEKDGANKFAGGINITIGAMPGQSVEVSEDISDAEYEVIPEDA